MAATSNDSEALSAYLTDLQNQVREVASPSLTSAIRALSEPLSFLGLLSTSASNNDSANNNTHNNSTINGSNYFDGTINSYVWEGPVEPTTQKRQYFIQHLLPNHLNFILDHITVDWLSAFTSAQQTCLFDAYFVPSLGWRHKLKHDHKQQQQQQQQQKQQPDTDLFQWDQLMVTVSIQTLVSRINANFQENHSFMNKTILRLLHKVLESYTLLDFLGGYYIIDSKTSRSGGSTKLEFATTPAKEAVSNSAWDSFLSKLYSIPTRISNTLGGNGAGFSDIGSSRLNVEDCFQEEFFFKSQISKLQDCMDVCFKEVRNTGTSKKSDPLIIAVGTIITKLIRLGHGKLLIEYMIEQLWGKEVTDTKCIGWKLALTYSNSLGTTSQFLTILVDYLDKNQLNFGDRSLYNTYDQKNIDSKSPEEQWQQQQHLAIVHRASNLLISIGFGTEKSEDSSENNNNSLIRRILSQGRVYGIGVLRTLVCVQSGWNIGVRSGKDSALADTLRKSLEIWSDSILVNHASADYQKFISFQVLLMIGYFKQSDIIEADLMSIFSDGITNWLELESFKRKQIGLVVAEEFSRAIDTIGSPADFGLDAMDIDVGFARSLVLLKDGARKYTSEAPSMSENTVDHKDFNQHTNSTVPTVENLLNMSHEDSDDEEDPDAIVDPFSRATIVDEDDSDSDDDDDELKPYEMDYESDPDEEIGIPRKTKVPAPLYLRDLISYLRASEDREKTEIGLKNASELIRRKAGSLELEEFSEAIANTLVQMQDNFDLSNFYKMRESALISIVVTSPVKASGVLTFQFYEKKNSIGQRLNILSALALGAREISGFDKPVAGTSSNRGPNAPMVYSTSSTAATASSSTTTLVGDSGQRPPLATFDSITSNISLARTRRFSQKTQIQASKAAPKVNAFSNLAAIFLGGLLGRWGGNRGAGMERGYDVLQKAPAMVLKKFVTTLGVLVHYAGNSIHIIPITRELFRFLLALRYHNPPSQPTPGRPVSSSFMEPAISAPTLTSLKLPGQIGITTKLGSESKAGSSLSSIPARSSLPYNAEMLESILFDLLILLTPASTALSDEVLLQEFYAEVMECQQWGMELWEVYKLEEGSGDKSRMYCAAMLQRCFELMEVSM